MDIEELDKMLDKAREDLEKHRNGSEEKIAYCQGRIDTIKTLKEIL